MLPLQLKNVKRLRFHLVDQCECHFQASAGFPFNTQAATCSSLSINSGKFVWLIYLFLTLKQTYSGGVNLHEAGSSTRKRGPVFRKRGLLESRFALQ